MSQPTQPDVLDEARPFLAQCGPCDAGLPMGCSHPNDDYRPVMARLVAEVEKLRSDVGYLERASERDERAMEKWFGQRNEARKELGQVQAELRRADIISRGIVRARDGAQRERDKLIEVVGRLMSLPPKTIADAYGVDYTGEVAQ